jgi:hypothetical protein
MSKKSCKGQSITSVDATLAKPMPDDALKPMVVVQLTQALKLESKNLAEDDDDDDDDEALHQGGARAHGQISDLAEEAPDRLHVSTIPINPLKKQFRPPPGLALAEEAPNGMFDRYGWSNRLSQIYQSLVDDKVKADKDQSYFAHDWSRSQICQGSTAQKIPFLETTHLSQGFEHGVESFGDCRA